MSRYTRYVKHRVPRRARAVYMPGSGGEVDGKPGDDHRWIRCWNCGFPLDTTTLVAGTGADNVQVQDFDYSELSPSVPASNALPGNLFNRPAKAEADSITPSLDCLGMVGTVIQLGADGTADSFTYTPRQITVTGGCSFCGTDNIFGS